MTDKPSEKEEEYFARIECEKRKKLEEARLKKLTVEDKQRIREAHYMKCPKCGMDLLEIDYHGIKIDKCCDCGGVWLDPGELEAIANLGHGKFGKLFHGFK